MIFRTITNEATGAIKSIGLFGKSLSELKTIIYSIKSRGIINTFFNTSAIDKTVVAEYNREIEKATANGATMAEKQQIMKTAMEGTNKATAQLIGSTKGATVSTEALTAAQHSSTFAARAQAVALKAASIAGNMILFSAISKAIQLATTAIDNWIHRVEKANEAMDEAVSEYESAKSSLESINSELEEQNQKIDELLSKDKLTYAEKGELEKLQSITKELLLQKDIEEKRMASASKEAAEKTLDAYQKQYGNYDVSKKNLNKKIENETFPIPTNENDIMGNIAAYIRAKEELEEVKDELYYASNKEEIKWFENDIQEYIDVIDDYSEQLDNNIADLQEKRLALEDEYNKAVEKRQTGTEPLTSSEKEIISTYDSIYEAIKLVYEYTNQNDWNNMEINNIFNAEGIEKTKEELIEMAEAGELSPEVIAGYKNLNKAIQNSELFLEDGEKAAEAFCDEISSAANAAEELSEATIENPTSSYKSSLDGVQFLTDNLKTLMEVYDDVQDGEEFDWSSILNNDDFEAVFSSAGEAYDDFIKTVTKNPDDITACQDAFDRLATSLIDSSGIWDDLTTETKEATIAMLEENGVVNAAELVTERLAIQEGYLALAKDNAALAGKNLSDLTWEEIASLLKEGEASDTTASYLASLAAAKMDVNSISINTQEDIDQIIAIANAAGTSTSYIQNLANALLHFKSMSFDNSTMMGKVGNSAKNIMIQTTQDKLKQELSAQLEGAQLDSSQFYAKSGGTGGGSGKSGSSGGGGSSAAKESIETFDFIETAIKRIEAAIERLKIRAEETFRSFTSRGREYKKAISEITKEINIQRQGYDAYMARANSIGLEESWAKQVRDGSINIADIADDGLKERIKNYKEW